MNTNSVYTVLNELTSASNVATSICSSDWITAAKADISCDRLSDRIDAIEQKIKKPDVDPTTKTEMVYKNGGIYVKHYKDGFFKNERRIMADIADVRVYDNTVVVMFTDKTKTSAVLDSVDTFTVEQGISVCVTKKLLGEEGSSIYNKLINRGLKVIKKNKKAAEKAAKEKEAAKQARALKKARSERRKAKKREESINIQAEAIKKAFAQIIGGKSTEV